MHGLTEAEARIVWSALAMPGAPERERLQGSGLASSTYHATRRRAYADGWLRDRYVPEPVSCGRPSVTFLIGRPYADELRSLARRWSAADGNALVWTGTPLALGVFFHEGAPMARRMITRLADEQRLRDLVSLTVDLTESRVPIYFDFEGAWAKVIGLTPSPEYPFGLGRDAAGPSVRSPDRRLPDRLRRSAVELLERPFAPESPGILRWLGHAGLDRRQRELIEEGYLRPRTFPDPSRMPEYRGRRVDQLVLVTGQMRGRADPMALLAELRSVHGISPFLFAFEGPRVLLGLLGHAGPPARGHEPVPGAPAPVGSILRDTLATRMERVDVYREDAAGIRPVVDHRYASLLAPSLANAAPDPRARRRAPAAG